MPRAANFVSITAMSNIGSNDVKSFFADVLTSIHEIVEEAGTDQLAEMSKEHFKSIGKMLRPRIIFDVGRALNVEYEHLVRWAACCEMLHNATLVHDDLQDGDTRRRGQPTTWSVYGAAQAINLGDFLMLLAPQLLLPIKIEAQKKVELMALYSRMSTRIVNGQSFEPILNQNFDASILEKNYFKCISQKTSALFASGSEGVVLLAGGDPKDVAVTSELFLDLGNIFQIQDDILDLYGDKQRDSIGCDIKEGKVSYLVVNHLRRKPQDAEILKGYLLKERADTSDDDVRAVLQLFESNQTLSEVIKDVRALMARIDDRLTPESMVLRNADFRQYVKDFSSEILKPIQHLMN